MVTFIHFDNAETAIQLSDIEKTTQDFIDLGLECANVKEYAKAEAAFRACLAFDPSNIDAHINLGTSLLRQGKPEEAIRCYGNAMILSTNDNERGIVYANLGDVYYYLKEWKEAIENYETAIALSDQQKTAMNFFSIGFAYDELKEHVKAEIAFRESLALDPSNTETNIDLGSSLARQGKYDEAIHFYQRGIELSTDDNERGIAYTNIGRICEVRKEWKEAIENYETAIALSDQQKTAMNFFSIGIAYDKLKEHVKAEIAFRESLALDPAAVRANINLGSNLVIQGKCDEAILYFEKGIEFGGEIERVLFSDILEKLYATKKKRKKKR